MTTDVIENERVKSPLAQAFGHASPIIMGYVPVGAAFGVLAHKTGLSMLSTVLMSTIVFAGSAQLIAVAMFAAGMPPLSIIATTFVVNLRHLLMSASLAPYLRSWKKRELVIFGYEITDESFAVHSARFGNGDLSKRVSIYTNMIAHVSWIVASWVGFMTGSAIPDVKPLGLDYALPAMFIALLTMQVKNGLHVFVAGFTGMAAIILVQSGADQWSVIIATLLGATFGAGVETWMKR
ncbi:AzlC family ABC transporter permease [Pseudodesulfovibrio sp. zrk46]|uniref:AzlC family ABC transporter permease n=1 Tax=Pseudodesulfovibrio sp. zrk46 TaxID=2725288 RepID=UPI001448ACC6|nr:AzlC family ABC transporter permease [Pseudodesulfovibrio sp. zrk46]QJB54997.1 AzlC family ABC transporter permease [Pseudodesulfovibrio sp. zrk46]